MLNRRRPQLSRSVLEAPPRLWEEFVLTRNRETRQALIEHYQGFVQAAAKTLSKKMAWGGLALDELVSQGQIGMMCAMERYQPERGPFKKFASPYMFGQIIDAVRKEDWLPRKYRVAQREMYFAQRVYSPDNPPTDQELANDLGWELQDIRELKFHLQRAIVLAVPEVGGRAAIAPVEWTLLRGFMKAFKKLPEHQKLIIALRYYGKVPMSKMTKHFPKKFPIAEHHAEALETLYLAALNEALTSDGDS